MENSAVCSILALLGLCLLFQAIPLSAEEPGLVNLNLKIPKFNLTQTAGSDSDGTHRRRPFFFNLDIPSIFSMRLDTKNNEGTSLGLNVLQPFSRFLRLIGGSEDERGSSLRIGQRSGKDRAERWADILSSEFLRTDKQNIKKEP